jgi:thioredoxin 1
LEREKMAGLLKSLFSRKKEETSPAVAAAKPPGEAGLAHVTDDTFDELVLQSTLPVLVDFWAPWCGPCRMLAPIVEELAHKYHGRLVVAKFNTDENLRVAGDFGIMGIPTLVIFRDGKEVDRLMGYSPRHLLEERLAEVL